MATHEEVRERVNKALAKCNTTKLQLERATVTLEIDRYDFNRTHLNASALDALEHEIDAYVKGESDDEKIKERIKAVRDTSEVGSVDFDIRVLEPDEHTANKMRKLFSVPLSEHFTRFTNAFQSDEERDEHLIQKTAKVFELLLEQDGYRTHPNGLQLVRLKKQFEILVKRYKGEPSAELKALWERVKDIVFENPNRKVARQNLREPAIVIGMWRDVQSLPQQIHMVSITSPQAERLQELSLVPALDTQQETIVTKLVETLEETKEQVATLAPAMTFGSDKSDAPQAEKPLDRLEPSPPPAPAVVKDVVSGPLYVGTLLDAPTNGDVVLDDDEKQLATLVESDEYELEREADDPMQEGLFGDISLPKVERRRMFTDEQMIDAAFKWHREQGFPYRDISPAMCMVELQDLAEVEGQNLISTRLGYGVADTFHKHRLAAAANGMSAPLTSFHDDKKLRKAIKLELKLAGKPRVYAGGMMTLVNGTQACSNFRPGFAAFLYRKYCPENATVLDTSTGYGGRLLGAFASQVVKKYIGIDPNVPTFQANARMIEELHLRQQCEFVLINQPAEDVDPEGLRETCDFSFTSPPYFAKEIYSTDDTQSWKRYSTGDAWRDGFLKQMLRLTYIALKPGAHAIVNIAPVKVKNKTYPLDDWTRELGVEVGFKYLDTEKFPMMVRFGKAMSDEVAFEPVIIFEKEKK